MMSGYPSYQAVEWVDPTLHVCWVTPSSGNETDLGVDLSTDATTTLLYSALHRVQADSAVRSQLRTAVIVNPTLSRDELLEAVLDEFEVHCASRSRQRRLESLLETMLDVRRRDGTTVLIVDEAQLLTVELLDELLSLLTLQTFHEKLLQIVLSGHQGT